MAFSRLLPLLLLVLSALLLFVSADSVAAQGETLPCPNVPLTYSDVPNLQAPWVSQCGHCLTNATPTGTVYPTLQPAPWIGSATPTPTFTLTPTATRTPTRTPTVSAGTAVPTTAGTPSPSQMISGSNIIPFQDDPSVASVLLGNFPIAPGYAIEPSFDPTYRTDTTGVVWEVVGFYYYIDDASTGGPSNFYLQPDTTNLFNRVQVDELQDFYAEYLAASGNFACFDAEIYTGSFDFACDSILEYFLYTDPDLFYGWEPIFGEIAPRVLFHSHSRHVFDPAETFSIPIAWQGGWVENPSGSSGSVDTAEMSLFAFVRYPYADYSPPPATPEPPTCTEVTFTAPNCGYSSIYFVDNNPDESYFADQLASGCFNSTPGGSMGATALTSAKNYDGGENGKFEGIGVQIDLGGEYPISAISFKPTNWGYTPSYYRGVIWVWDVNANQWDKIYGDSPLDYYTNTVFADWDGTISRIYLATGAITAYGLPRATHEIKYSDIWLAVDTIPEAFTLNPNTKICPPPAPTGTPQPTAIGGTSAATSTSPVQTFTRTPTRTPSPSPTTSVNSYCLHPQWRNTPTPTLISTSTPTLNATHTSLAVTRTPNALPTVQQQFTQTAAAATGTGVVITSTHYAQTTATQSVKLTATGAAPLTATYIASTPGNDYRATSESILGNVSDAPVVGGGSGHSINIGGAPELTGNSTLDLNDRGSDMLYRFSWDPQPRPGSCTKLGGGFAIDLSVLPYKPFGNFYQAFPEFRLCVNWVDIPAMEALGYGFPLELLILPIFLVLYRRLWALGGSSS